MRAVGNFLRDKRGTTAVEFAIVGPTFIMLVIGLFYAGLMLFAIGSMYFAVEDAARCASVQTNVCPTNDAAISYARSHYNAAAVLTASFGATTAACGHSVTGTANFSFNTGAGRLSVPISVTSCYP